MQAPISDWPEDPEEKELGMFARFGFEEDMPGLIGYAATVLGDWTMEELEVWMAQLRRELKSRRVHGWHTYKVVYGQKPEA